jgi:hypothetical protein
MVAERYYLFFFIKKPQPFELGLWVLHVLLCSLRMIFLQKNTKKNLLII